jgi:hypothetical protein
MEPLWWRKRIYRREDTFDVRGATIVTSLRGWTTGSELERSEGFSDPLDHVFEPSLTRFENLSSLRIAATLEFLADVAPVRDQEFLELVEFVEIEAEVVVYDARKQTS